MAIKDTAIIIQRRREAERRRKAEEERRAALTPEERAAEDKAIAEAEAQARAELQKVGAGLQKVGQFISIICAVIVCIVVIIVVIIVLMGFGLMGSMWGIGLLKEIKEKATSATEEITPKHLDPNVWYAQETAKDAAKAAVV